MGDTANICKMCNGVTISGDSLICIGHGGLTKVTSGCTLTVLIRGNNLTVPIRGDNLSIYKWW